MQREGRSLVRPLRVVAAMALIALGSSMALAIANTDEQTDVRTIVTQWNTHGIPYAKAKAVGRRGVPELVSMLGEANMEEHWTKVVWVLGCVGDPSATGTLVAFLKGQQGEISTSRFRATLAVLPALGHLARGGDATALKTLAAFTRPDGWRQAGLTFSYGRYRGDALGEVLGRTAIQGLGIAGTPEAMAVLESLNQSRLRRDWRDNVDEAMQLNQKVGQLGADLAFAEEEKQ